MSSFLEKQQNLFQKALSSASSKLSNKKTTGVGGGGAVTGSPSLAPPSPSPSIGSTTSRNDATPSGGAPKRKRQDVVYSQPEATGSGGEMGTQMVYALSYLRDRSQETKTLHDVLGHLSLLNRDDGYKERFVENLRRHPRVDFTPDESVTEQKWHVGTYRYRPVIPGVRDKATLLRFLQERTDSSGVQVKDLKDGWVDCEPALTELQGARKILVIRTKKEENPKHVFLDDPDLSSQVDAEFRTMWMRVAVPKVDELPRKLMAVGQKPASDEVNTGPKIPMKQKQQKKRAGRKMGRVTNTHMQDILKDFSGVKR